MCTRAGTLIATGRVFGKNVGQTVRRWHILAYTPLRAPAAFDTILSAAPLGRCPEPQHQEPPGDPSSPPARAPGRGARRSSRGYGLDARLHRAGAAHDAG